jgi:hypothetical protein
MKVGSKADEKRVKRGRRIDNNEDEDDDDDDDDDGDDASAGRRSTDGESDDDDADMSGGSAASDMGRLDAALGRRRDAAALERKRKRERRRERDVMREEIELGILGAAAGNSDSTAAAAAAAAAPVRKPALSQAMLDQIAASRFPPADELAARAESLAAGSARSLEMLIAGITRDTATLATYTREVGATGVALETCDRDALAMTAVADALDQVAELCAAPSAREDRLDAEQACRRACEAVAPVLAEHADAARACGAPDAIVRSLRPILETVVGGDGGAWIPEVEPARGVDAFARAACAVAGLPAPPPPPMPEPGSPIAEPAGRAPRVPEHRILTRIISNAVVPPVAEYALHRWGPTNPAPMCAVAEAWRAVWPTSIKSIVFRDSVAPRLVDALQRPQRAAPHLWIHPWLPLAGTRRLADVA